MAKNYEDDLTTPYVFSYTLEPSEEKASVLHSISEKLNLPLHVISDPHYSEEYVKSSWSIPCKMNVCEERWISLIKNASFVVTDSFHGMCLAIIYQKPFIAIANPVRGITRFESIGALLGIQNRIINSLEDIDFSDAELFSPVDYNKIDLILSSEKERSMKWLTTALHVLPKKERDFCELDALKAHIEDIDYIASRNGYRISLVEQHGVNVDSRFDADEQRIANVEKHGVDVDSRFDATEQSISNLEQAHSDYKKQFEILHSMILKTQHRTLYGACAWLFHRIIRKK